MVNFDFQKKVIEKSFELPVVVDFWAPWCGPCLMLSPILEKLATQQKGYWTLVKINTEEEQELVEQYNIRSIPNMKLFYKGKVVADLMGAYPRTVIERWLEEFLPKEITADASNNKKDTLKEESHEKVNHKLLQQI